jgi:hypothetical protein
MYKQLIYSYKVEKNKPEPLTSNSYPSCRPLKHYRKQGVQSSLPVNSTCNSNCSPVTIGLPYGLLGKNENGESKMCCENTQGPVGSVHGNVISFSGNAKLRSSVQPNLKTKPYYTESNSYLKSRGNTFHAKSTFSFEGSDGSSYNETTQTICPQPVKTIYKPNNRNFSTQGAVSSDTRLHKLKHDTIVKNNASFTEVFKTKISYQENPIFFEKNKINICSNTCGI